MQIVIDARMYQESGIGRYIRNLLAQLQEVDKENEYFILHLRKDYDVSVYHNNFRKVLADFRWYGATEQIRLPKLLKSLKPDVVHFPHFNAPIFYKGKFVVTIHDLIHQHFSMKRATTHGALIHKLKQIGYSKVFKNAIYRSVKILVPSNYVKELLVNEWKVEESKVVVTHEAVDENILEKSHMSDFESHLLIKRLGIRQPFIFYVGNAHPHKNVEGLVRAFREIKEKHPDLSLVLAGNDHYFWQRVKKENNFEGLIYTGFVSDEQLVALYKNAKAFILPSFEEGFGIPVLEAFATGCPVISSKEGSLMEVGGDAALYFDPLKKGEMGKMVERVLESEKLRKELVLKGKERVKDFSWRKLARQTLEVYKQCG